MSYQKQPYTKQASRPSTGAESVQAVSAKATDSEQSSEATKTTHYAKNTNKEFVNNIQIWENEGKFGKFLKIRVSEALAPGDYYISARKDHN